ncbi:UNVERIFIED_CONTAM: hypothetical protein HDU68_001747 [Siphonaria sp. JEL0065]|nr:hypothetical protein HDU68_001747 [Siphonaria sp. JEL0065]
MISKRAQTNLGNSSTNLLDVGMSAASKNPYDAVNNPDGIINMGVAENSLMAVELTTRMQFPMKTTDLAYGSFRGSFQLREQIGGLFNRRLQLIGDQKVSAKHVVVGNGAGSIVNAAAQIFGDVGDGFLIPAPVYGAFRKDVVASAQVVPIFVHAENSLPSVQQLELARASSQTPIKAILITNPGNPTGRVIPQDLLREWIAWAHKHDLHAIVDEVYLFSVWDKRTEFVSVLQMENVDPQRTHVIWSFSKDFCLNGLRVGALISKNQQVIAAYKELSYFHSIPRIVENSLVEMLSDVEFVDKFMETNHERLRVNFAHAKSVLTSNEIPYLNPDSAFFIWIDLSFYVSHPSIVAESAAQNNLSGTLILFQKFLKAGIYIAPAEAFFSNPRGPDASRFRINVPVPLDVLELGLQRILSVLNEIK